MKQLNRRDFLKTLSASALSVPVVRAATAGTASLAFFSSIKKAVAQSFGGSLGAWRSRKKMMLAANGTMLRSNDGIQFSTSPSLPPILTSQASWTDIAWNGSVYCAANGGPQIATSSDLSSWTTRTTPLATCSRITVSGSMFIAIQKGSTNKCATSTDGGVTWTSRTLPATASWVDIVWNGTIFCALASNDIAATSPDGITWTQRTLPTDGKWDGLAWNGSVFCACAYAGNLATSSNGITWTLQTSMTGLTLTDITTSGSTFYLLGYSTGQVYTSTDGIVWAAYGVVSNGPLAIATNGTAVVTEAGSFPYSSSNGGTSWATGFPNVNAGYRSLRYINGLFIVVGFEWGTPYHGLAYSADGSSWTQSTMPVVQASGTFHCLARLGSNYCLMPFTTASQSLYSSDGTNWSTANLPVTTSWAAIASNGSILCAVPFTTGNTGMTSSDAINWTTMTLPSSQQWVDIVWTGSMFFALSGWNSSTVGATSPDGVTWTIQTLPNAAWRTVIWTGSIFLAVPGNGATYATSPDGVTWTPRTFPVSDNWGGLAWNGVNFLTATTSGVAYTSPDGINWTAKGTAPGIYVFEIVWNGYQFILLGSSGYISVSSDGTSWTTVRSNVTAVHPGNQFGKCTYTY